MTIESKPSASVFGSDMVVLRYAHAFAGGGGGVEQYLEHLDRSLLARYPWTIIRILLSGEETELREERTAEGRGHLVKVLVPVAGQNLPELVRQGNQAEEHHRFRDLIRDFIIYNPLIWPLFGKRYVLNRPIKRRSGEPQNIHAIASDLISRYKVNLAMLHFQGGADAEDVITAARMQNVSVGLLNHFANDRFRHLSMRKHAMLADGVSGVSGLDVPGYLAGTFVNLADGIDTAFFSPEELGGSPDRNAPVILLLPARVVRNKGHLDLVLAARKLVEKKLDVQVHFAGREEPGEFSNDLRKAIAAAGLEGRIRFLGTLDQRQLKAAYASASVVVLPTYHHEGLPRVAIEAQAMRIPVVIYSTGGSGGAIQHKRSGYLVPTGDMRVLVDCLEKLITDPGLRHRMGQAGRKFVEQRFTLASLAERHAAFYQQAAAKSLLIGATPGTESLR